MLYWVTMRGTWFAALLIVLVVGLVVWAPLTWASANRAVMGPACEGPCGAASCATFGAPARPGLPFVGDLRQQDPNEPSSAVSAVIELPPRSSLLSAYP